MSVRFDSGLLESKQDGSPNIALSAHAVLVILAHLAKIQGSALASYRSVGEECEAITPAGRPNSNGPGLHH